MRFTIDWASLTVGSKFTISALSYFVFEGSFSKYKPLGGEEAYIWRGDLTEGVCVTGLGGLYLKGLIHGGAYFRILRYLLCNSTYAEEAGSRATSADSGGRRARRRSGRNEVSMRNSYQLEVKDNYNLSEDVQIIHRGIALGNPENFLLALVYTTQ